MYDEQLHGFCFEFRTIEKTVQVAVNIGGEQLIRIEALRDEKTGKYSTNSMIQVNTGAHGTYWVEYELPWVVADSADSAITRALGFLKDKCAK